MQCPNCGFLNPGGFKFCGQCGQPLLAAPAAEAERRQLTVMFCDLVNSSVLAEELDPEEYREVIQAYQAAAAGVIGRFEGHIAQYLGDGLLVYFGYPQAHEDDTRRAVLAGLGILEAIEALNGDLPQLLPHQPQPLRLAARIGVHTGLTVVGEIGTGGRREQLAVGAVTNLAARLQGLAEPQTLVMSGEVYRLVQGLFTCQPLGTHQLKGLSQTVEIYRVIRESRARSRLDAALATAHRLAPLVGREQEKDRLLSCWAKARAGQGQVILLSGEAGLGKSRLVHAFKEAIAGEPYLWFSCYGSAYYQNSAFYPIIDMVQRLLRFKAKDSLARKLSKLEFLLKRYELPLDEHVPLFANLLSLPLPTSYTPLNLSPQRQKQKTEAALLAILLKLSAKRPLVIVVEDLHWVDPSTLELLGALVNQTPRASVLTLLTCRPVFHPPWPSGQGVTHLPLARLNQSQAQQMIRQMSGEQALPPDLLRQIVTRTDGIPIFVEEVTRMVLEKLREASPGAAAPALTIPATLHDSLMARLDRLEYGRETAQLAATLGRDFSYPLLRAISPLDEAGMERDLDYLVEVGLLYRQGTLPQASYGFKHVLIQEAAYRSLLRRKRQRLHRQIAGVLAEQFPELAQTEPELLARHYTLAGLEAQAIPYWQQAGQRAAARSANLEAINHFKQGLALLERLPESPERFHQELELQMALGAPLLMTRGYAAPEVEPHYARARELSRQLGDLPHLWPALFGLWVFYLVRADYTPAQELGDQLMRLAEQTQEPLLQLQAYQVQGINNFYRGNLAEAQRLLEQALALYSPRQPEDHLALYGGADAGVACLSHLALALWLLGYPEQALQRSQEALTLARRLDHPYSLTFALALATWLYQYNRQPQLTRETGEAAITLAAEQGFTLLGEMATILVGWARTEQGEVEEGIAQIFQGLAGFRATGAALGQPHFLALLAEIHLEAGQLEEGLAVVTGALAAVQARGDRFYEAELYRLKGELLAQIPAQAEAEAAFRHALNVARQQQARSLAFRATASLSRLWQMAAPNLSVKQTFRLADRLMAIRRRRFVGREAEIGLFRSALLADEAHFAVLYIYGPGGVGKTTLLREYARLAMDSGRAVIHLDGRNLEPSPPGFLLALRQVLKLEDSDLSPTVSDWLPPGVLLIDTYESLASLDTWLRESFLPQLPAQSLVVIAGRNPPAPAWRTDIDWGGLTRIISLRNLRPEESQTYLTICQIPPEYHPEVLAFTHGHPLALSLVADVLSQGDRLAAFNLQREPDVMKILLERFVQYIPSLKHRQALEICAHVWATTETLLAHILGEEDAPTLFEWLRSLSFIEQGPQGLFPHDLAREVLDADLRWRNPGGYQELHQRVRRYIVRRLQEASGLEQHHAFFDLIYLNRNNPLIKPYLEWNSFGSAYAKLAAPQDHPLILEMIQQYEGEASAQIARYWLQRQPQAFTVFWADQQPIGFLASLILHEATPADLEADPAIKAAWTFAGRYGPLRPGEEMIYKRFWAGRETGQMPSPVFNMVVMISTKQWFTNPRLAWSFAAYADLDYWQPVYGYINFQRSPEADFEVEGRHYGVFTHDWRIEPVVAWLEMMGRRELATEAGPGLMEPPLMVLSQPEFAEAVRQALRDYTHPDLLAVNPLMRSRLILEVTEQPASPAALQARLREAAATLTGNPRDKKFYQAIYHTYLEPAPTQERAAEHLGLPFNTYRYHLAKGIERITNWLWQRELNEANP